VFLRGLDVCGAVVASTTDDEWDLPSPCEGWSARDVLGHLFSAMRMGLAILGGTPVDAPSFDRPGDLVGDDPAAEWATLDVQLRSAVVGVDLDAVRDTPMGRRTVEEGLAFPAIDLFVHAWDISTAAGRPIEVPEDVIAFAHHHIDPFPDEVKRGGRVFGPKVEARADATATEQFVAWTGREPRTVTETGREPRTVTETGREPRTVTETGREPL